MGFSEGFSFSSRYDPEKIYTFEPSTTAMTTAVGTCRETRDFEVEAPVYLAYPSRTQVPSNLYIYRREARERVNIFPSLETLKIVI